MAGIRDRFWQTCTALGKNSWGYIKGMEYKLAHEVIEDLVDIVSKNGTLLLNVGPKPDGTIPPEDTELLLAIGKWLDVNGEAIYGTRPWVVYGEGPTEIQAGAFKDTERSAFTSQDFRFTTKPGVVFAIVMAAPTKNLEIRSLGSDLRLLSAKIDTVELLGSPHKIKWQQVGSGLKIELPEGVNLSEAAAFKCSYKTE